MHILVVNDDGPPSNISPYVQSLVDELQSAGHVVSVVLPYTQQSWIGKAHMIDRVVRCVPSDNPDQEGWFFVDGTPATCAQVGLNHLFQNRGPVDLVVCGPNFGQNITVLFALSSGTLGAAMEAALCGKYAIALSYSKPLVCKPQAVTATARHSVRIIEALVKQWPQDGSVDIYSVNMPVEADVAGRKVVWCGILENHWHGQSSFEELTTTPNEAIDKSAVKKEPVTRYFRWAPNLGHIDRILNAAPVGTDGWATRNGYTRQVTGL
jgi:5'/3'-nucleotidase SurE